MPGSTPNYGLPFPELDEAANGPEALQQLAEATDTALDGIADDVAAITFVIPVSTTLPGSPTNGQHVILTDSLTSPTWQWLCRYDSSISDSHKWRVIGPVPLVAEGQFQNLSASYTQIAAVTTPRAGVYICRGLVYAANGASDPNPIVRLNGGELRGISSGVPGTTRSVVLQYEARQTAGAGQVLEVLAKANGSDATFAEGSVALTPVRIS